MLILQKPIIVNEFSKMISFVFLQVSDQQTTFRKKITRISGVDCSIGNNIINYLYDNLGCLPKSFSHIHLIVKDIR